MDGVTVLIPTFNAMPYLAYAVNSALQQSYQKIEILIINDGSTDDTKYYLNKLTDQRIRIIHKKNEGLVATLNLGLIEAKYNWIARLDSDDLMRKDRIEKQIYFADQFNCASVIASNYGFIDEKNNILKIKKELKLKNPPFFDPMNDPNIPHQGVLYRKDHILKVGGYRDLVPAEDLDLWLRVTERYKIVVVNEILTYIRILNSGISLKNFEKQRIMWKYVKDCAMRRRIGDKELPFDYWIKENKNWILQKQRKWKAEKEIRLFGFYLMTKKYTKAITSSVKAILYHPTTVFKKFKSYKFKKI